MKCPLRIFVVRCGEETGTGYMPDCLKEECAWWDFDTSQCGIALFTEMMSAVYDKLDAIAQELTLREK